MHEIMIKNNIIEILTKEKAVFASYFVNNINSNNLDIVKNSKKCLHLISGCIKFEEGLNNLFDNQKNLSETKFYELLTVMVNSVVEEFQNKKIFLSASALEHINKHIELLVFLINIKKTQIVPQVINTNVNTNGLISKK